MSDVRVVITGATGNLGTSVLEALAGESAVQEVVGIARRRPQREFPRTTFVEADIVTDDLEELFAGSDAVIHLAWLIQPGHDESVTRAVNVTGSQRVFEAAASAGVPSLLYASSVGAYSAGPKDRLVPESWPTDGTPTSFYARHKAITERQLDRLERERPDLRVVRLRPALVFKRAAASEIRRLFIGPFLPRWMVRPEWIPFVPDLPRLRFQAVHSLDVGDAFRRALVSGVRGAFNLAAEPVIGTGELAEVLDARPLKLPAALLRSGAAATFKLHLQPSEPGWVDMALAVPLMDSTRAREELGWVPQHSATDALAELLAGIRSASDLDTPPLARGTSGPARLRELLTGVGSRV
jgi:UDP-glucose 4-epimerase